MSRRRRRTVAWATLAVAVLAVVDGAGVRADGGVRSGSADADRPSGTSSKSGVRRLFIKFHDDRRIRVRSGALTDAAASADVASSSGSAKYRQADLDGVRTLLAGIGASGLQPLFALPERYLDDQHARLERSTGETLANQNSYAVVTVPGGTDVKSMLRLLRHLPAIEAADVMPEPSPLPSPSFVAMQGHLRAPAAGGIGVASLDGVRGSRGGNVRIVDLEYSWNVAHEDLERAARADARIPMRTYADPFYDPQDPHSSLNHGTAVLGLLSAVDDAQGVTGIAPDADLHMVNTYAVEGYDPANAIAIAHANMVAGDVMLIEQQAAGPIGCGGDQFGCVPIEWYQVVYDAIKAATADGIIVVEAAGNGTQDLDAAPYAQPFPAGRPDSGAIIVGAGSVAGCSAPAGTRLWYSNYGNRVDLQGWGECVATTGYGTLFNGSPNASYTSSFSGTSSAAAIVAGAAAVLSSVAEEQQMPLSPIEVRALLVASGRPGPLGSGIGPLPNLAAALRAFVPTAVIKAPAFVLPGSLVALSGAASADPQGGPLQYAWSLDGDGRFDDGTTSSINAAAPLSPGMWAVSLRVTDAHGAASTDAVVVPVEFRRASAPDAPEAPGTTLVRTVAPPTPVATAPPRGRAPVAG